ncbi:MAG: type II toxin-antitoxin system VapC family toxin [Wenzhouxiangella sp.]
MIAVDTNILVYAHREDSPFHEQAFAGLAALANSNAAWAIPWPCLHEFYSIVTHPRIFNPPSSQPTAIDQVEAWLESPSLHLIGETARHWAELRDLLVSAKLVGPRVHDARIAAICLQHGISELWSADRDFSAFPTLKARNPCLA